jgi:signal transduction histidine kinase
MGPSVVDGGDGNEVPMGRTASPRPADQLRADAADPADLPFLRGQVRVLRAIALGAPLAEALELLVRTIEDAAPGMRASILLLDEDGLHLRHGAAPSLPSRYTEAIDGLTIGPNVGSCGTAAHLGEPVVVRDIPNDERWADFVELAAGAGVQACWSTPIRSHRNEILGTFAMYYDEVREPGAAEERLIAIATDLASIAIQRDRAFALEAAARELELAARHVDRLQDLNQAAVAINSQAALPEMLATITEQACTIVGAHQGATSVTEPGTGAAAEYPQVTTRGWSSAQYAARHGEAPSLGAVRHRLVCEHNQVVRMTDDELRSHPARAAFDQEAGQHPPMRGWLAAPLVASDGANLGMIELSDKRHGDFDPADEAVLVQLAQVAAGAIEKARLHEVAADRDRQRLREELLAGLSHDMQTPLATITGLVDWLDRTITRDDHDAGRDDRIGRTLATLHRQSDHLNGLVQQFLDYSRLQAGRELAVGHTPVDLRAAVEQVVALHAHHHDVDVDAPDGPITAPTDLLRLQQVLSNLLSNAVRFAQGPIRVRIEPGTEQVLVHVDDDGPGVPPADRGTIFDRFYRGDESSGTPGTGLGLYVSREVLRAMGGDLVAGSSPEEGARFTIRLPAGDVDDRRAGDELQRSSERSTRR